MLKNLSDCHAEEPQAVLSETKEGSLQSLDFTTAEILRFALDRPVQGFAQNAMTKGLFSSLLESKIAAGAYRGYNYESPYVAFNNPSEEG